MPWWHMVHAWYLPAKLCVGTLGVALGMGAPPASKSLLVSEADSVWHCKQRAATVLVLSKRALLEPCGTWQALQPSVRTGTCSNSQGPFLSAWHL